VRPRENWRKTAGLWLLLLLDLQKQREREKNVGGGVCSQPYVGKVESVVLQNFIDYQFPNSLHG